MLTHKEKPCKGNEKVNKYPGCGKMTMRRQYGLCPSCFFDWMYNTPEGKQYRDEKFNAKVEKKTEQRQKDYQVKQRKKRQRMRKDLLTVNQFRKQYVQPHFNRTVRIIDQGWSCIAHPERFVDAWDAGHFYSVGSNLTLALNFHNCHRQSVESNQHNGGDPLEYMDGLRYRFGDEYAEWVRGLKKCPPLKLGKPEMEFVKKTLQKFNLLNEGGWKMLSPTELVQIRNYLNSELGLYPAEFSVYEGKVLGKKPQKKFGGFV